MDSYCELTTTAELFLGFEFNVENSPRATTHFERSVTLVFSSLNSVNRGQEGGFKCHNQYPKKTQKYSNLSTIHLWTIKHANMKRPDKSHETMNTIPSKYQSTKAKRQQANKPK